MSRTRVGATHVEYGTHGLGLGTGSEGRETTRVNASALGHWGRELGEGQGATLCTRRLVKGGGNERRGVGVGEEGGDDTCDL